MKTAGAAIYANRHYLELFKRTRPERLARDDGEKGPKILENVFIHHGAKIHPEAVLGPNVSVGKNVVVGAGTRYKDTTHKEEFRNGTLVILKRKSFTQPLCRLINLLDCFDQPVKRFPRTFL